MTDEPVLFVVEDGIAWVTLNRPDHGNALDLAMAQALLDIALTCDGEPSIRCVVLTGMGKLFCGGGDVHAFAAAKDDVARFMANLAGVIHRAISHFMRMPKPLITLVNGAAGGIGVSMAVMGDYVLAARPAHFSAAYGAIGLTPDGGLSWSLPRLVGLRNAQRMLIGNERVGAEEAEKIGLITRVVDEGALAEEGTALAQRLASSATAAIGGARQLLLASFQSDVAAHLHLEAERVTAAGAGAESREGVAAFLQRRKPDFRGA